MIIIGNLLDTRCNYLVHQCNCTTTTSLGLATQIFKKWPGADTYFKKIERIPGTLHLIPVDDDKTVVNLYGQRIPGFPRPYETREMRLRWFAQGCKDLALLVHDGSTVAFPYNIGCGLAGGSWQDYLKEIRKFQGQVESRGVKIVVVCLVSEFNREAAACMRDGEVTLRQHFYEAGFTEDILKSLLGPAARVQP